MRLLHTQKLELSEFNNEASRPYYAILSHTWGDDELIFSDFAKSDRRLSSGWRKIAKCCELAAADGWEYVWVDTCCIDKSSSAELTEAINSMWKWYQSSQMCYVHLADCSASNGNRDLPKSRWFTRGWTLQELLAPGGVVFYDANWQEMGSRSYLQHDISEICRIAIPHLKDPTTASVATKMSWASQRETTREEDLAYSLLGLFGIHMSLIYGEGSNAFFRLQSEIIRSSADQSIFAWSLQTTVDGFQDTGMLAPSLSCFVKSGDIVPKHFRSPPQKPYQMTNHGLQIEFDGVRITDDSGVFLSRSLEPGDRKIRKLLDFLTAAPEMLGPRFGSSLPHLYLVMLPCVRTIQNAQPIALLIHRSRVGRPTRASTRLIMSLDTEMLPGYSSLRFERMSFLIANEDKADHRLWPVVPKGPTFIKIGPELQAKVHHAQGPDSSPLYFEREAKHPFVEHSRGAQLVFVVRVEGGLRLLVVSNFVSKKCSVFTASEEQCSRLFSNYDNTSDSSRQALMPLSSYVGTYIVTLGEMDDYALHIEEELHILIRTRRVFTEVGKYGIVNPYGGVSKEVSCAIRLDLCTIPER